MRFAGNGISGYSGDGGQATSATFRNPSHLSYDPSGAIIVSEVWNHRIRRVSVDSGIITTIAGNGNAGFTGDGGLATVASLSYPYHAMYGPDGCLYIADMYNFAVRKVDTQGYMSTLAGTGER